MCAASDSTCQRSGPNRRAIGQCRNATTNEFEAPAALAPEKELQCAVGQPLTPQQKAPAEKASADLQQEAVEAAAAKAAPREALAEAEAEALLSTVDTNGDGAISAD